MNLNLFVLPGLNRILNMSSVRSVFKGQGTLVVTYLDNTQATFADTNNDVYNKIAALSN